MRKPPFQPPRATHKKPPLRIQVTTLWDYPSQDYGETHQGRPGYKGATPSYIIWNLLQRYTTEKDLVVDPFCGSGTTLDVARDLNRARWDTTFIPRVRTSSASMRESFRRS